MSAQSNGYSLEKYNKNYLSFDMSQEVNKEIELKEV